MKMRKVSILLVSVLCALSLLLTGVAQSELATIPFAGGSGTESDPWQVETAEQLDSVRNYLDGHFILSADIDLAEVENWEPIGTYMPASEEDYESADLELAFTGSFDGAGHTIRNMRISKPGAMSVGLFGCVAGDAASITNFAMENIAMEGGQLVGGVIGYGTFPNTIENVSLIGENTITGGAMTAGIVGGGFCSLKDCSAAADIIYTETNENSGGGAGILAGGMDSNSFDGCTATGSITVQGAGGFFGGLAACAHASTSITNCTVDAVITVGENAKMVGGLVGHAGTFDVTNPTTIEGCSVNVTITVPQSAQRVGGIIGSGFYQGDTAPSPSIFKVSDSSTSGSITGGTIVGTIAGFTYTDSIVENCTSDMTINGEDGPQIGATGDDVTLEQIK